MGDMHRSEIDIEGRYIEMGVHKRGGMHRGMIQGGDI